MLKKKVPLFILLSVIAILLITLACTLRPISVSAAEYMRLSKESRVEYAQDRYAVFAANPNKKYEILISFNEVPYTEIAALLSGQSKVISAFHCFDANGECAMGNYTECEGKAAEQVIEDYYANIHNLVVGQIESYDDYVEALRKSYGVDTDEESKEPNMALENALRDAERLHAQFVLQKEAMDNGDFYIYGIRIVMTGAEIETLLSSNTVALVEILNFDNNSLITPIR